MIRIIRWHDFQHYKNRLPPWIRSYSKLLDDPEYRALSFGARSLLHDLWWLASEGLDGCVHMDSETLAWRLREEQGGIVTRLSEIASQKDGKLPKWIELDPDASKTLATCKQDAIPETEQRQSRAETELPVATARAGKSWLSPYLAIWHDVFGGKLAIGRAAKAFGPLRKEHPEEEVLARWRHYCERHSEKPGIGTPQGFAATYGSWNPDTDTMNEPAFPGYPYDPRQ